METSFLHRLQVISTDMASSSSRRQNSITIGEADVLQQLEHSRKFSWAIYRKCDIIRPVGIIISFDEKPFCTVDFEVVSLPVPQKFFSRECHQDLKTVLIIGQQISSA